MTRTVTITLGIAPVVALLGRAADRVRLACMAVRYWRMDPAARDPEGLRRLALRRADLERRL